MVHIHRPQKLGSPSKFLDPHLTAAGSIERWLVLHVRVHVGISYRAMAGGSKTLHLPHVFVCQEINPFNAYLIMSFLVSKIMGVVKHKIVRKNIIKNVMKNGSTIMKNTQIMFF